MEEFSSRPTIGFVVLSHCDDGLVDRLIGALDRAYNNPQIVIHHDFSQAPNGPQRFGSNVRLVRPHVRTGWAKWSVVDAALKALTLLCSGKGVDWFFLLSASDYPVMPGEEVRRALAGAHFDALLDLRSVTGRDVSHANIIGPKNEALCQFDSPDNFILKQRFYLAPQVRFPILRTKPRLRVGMLTFRPMIPVSTPFGTNLDCYCGDHWFAGNRKVMDALLGDTPLNQTLKRYFSKRPIPEEAYYATLLANTPGLTINRDTRRFAQWNGGGAHPMILTEAQLPEILQSGAYFARKMSHLASLVGLIDQRLAMHDRD